MLDVPKLILTIWLMLWVMLVILLVMKFCFNQWYPIVSHNQNFIDTCNYIDNHKWLDTITMMILYVFASNVIFLTAIGDKKYYKWYFWLLAILIPLGAFGLKYISNLLGFIFELFILVILPIIINIKTNKFKSNIFNILVPIIEYALINLWQLTIYFVRGLDIKTLDSYSSLIYIILQLDYYIFIIITWIGVCIMGLLGPGWLWNKSSTELKAMKEKELSRKTPNLKLIARIDEEIAKLEKAGK